MVEARHPTGSRGSATPRPLGDDWLNWDPFDIPNYPSGAGYEFEHSARPEPQPVRVDAGTGAFRRAARARSNASQGGPRSAVRPWNRGRVWHRKNNELR